MLYTKLLQELDLPAAVVLLLEERRNVISGHEALISGLTDPRGAAEAYSRLDEALGEDDMGMLACQLYATLQTREKYRQLGIGDDVFLDTMGCFRRFLLETYRKTGQWCYDRAWWSYRQLSMRIFRIGQLEYETVLDEPALSVHIPSDARITGEAVDRSIEACREFFGKFFPYYANAPMRCESWLLSPALREHLDPDSRILAFQNRFSVHHTDPEPKDVWEWLFCASYDTPVEDLPERTSLQRRVKKYMLSGGRIGVAEGVMK